MTRLPRRTTKSKRIHLRQEQEGECGMVCVAYVLDCLDVPVSIRELRRAYNVNIRGLTLGNLKDLLGDYGVDVEPGFFGAEPIGSLEMPCIASWGGNHFVVIEGPCGKNEFIVYDPAAGVSIFGEKDLLAQVSAFISVRAATSKILVSGRPASRRIRYLGQVANTLRRLSRQHIKPNLKWIGKSLALTLLLESATLFLPILVAIAINDLAGSSSDMFGSIEYVTLGYLLVTLLMFLIGRLRARCLVSLDIRVRYTWFNKVITHLINLPEKYFQTRATGETLSKLQSINALTHYFSGSLIETLINGIFATAIVVVLGLIHYGYAGIWLASTLVYLLFRSRKQHEVENATREAALSTAKQEGLLFETVQTLRPLRSFNILSARLNSWKSFMDKQALADAEMQNQIFDFKTISSLIFSMAKLSTLYLGAWLTIVQGSPVGFVVAALTYVEIANRRIASLIDSFFSAQAMQVHVERVADITEEPILKKKEVVSQINTCKPAVTLENVSFRYGCFDDWVFKNISFTIEHGECVLLSGESGVGKSTLIKMISGVLEPTEGVVSIYGKDTREYQFHPSVCGPVFQDDKLFAGTIGQNISPYDPDNIDTSRLQMVLEACGLTKFIEDLSMGIHTSLGELSASISGGQKQRILIARAMYLSPSLLLLDEATSNLDEKNEVNVMDATRKLECTRVFATHHQLLRNYSNCIIDIGQDGSVKVQRVSQSSQRTICV